MSKWLERAKIPHGRIKEFEQNLQTAEFDEKAIAEAMPARLKFFLGVNLGFAKKVKACTGKLALQIHNNCVRMKRDHRCF